MKRWTLIKKNKALSVLNVLAVWLTAGNGKGSENISSSTKATEKH